MLEGDRHQGKLEECLKTLDCCTPIPGGEEQFFSKTGPLPTEADERRRFARFYYRRKAALMTMPSLPLLDREETIRCVYVRDISKLGVGFLYQEQLFPGEKCLFYLPELGNRLLEVASCRRLEPGCYAVGSRFQAADEPSTATALVRDT